jgi:hypothetical protein
MKKTICAMTCFLSVFALFSSVLAADSPLVVRSKKEGVMMNESARDVYKILNAVKKARDRKLENEMNGKYSKHLVKGVNGLNEYEGAIINFITYGTPSTLRMPAKERSGALDSYKRAFKKLPISADEWTDLVLICNGSQPLKASPNAEAAAKLDYRKVYGLEANLSDKKDRAAVLIMAYGVRPVKQDLNKERKAILKFEKAFGFKPTLNSQWDIVRAIAYSGVFY